MLSDLIISSTIVMQKMAKSFKFVQMKQLQLSKTYSFGQTKVVEMVDTNIQFSYNGCMLNNSMQTFINRSNFMKGSRYV